MQLRPYSTNNKIMSMIKKIAMLTIMLILNLITYLGAQSWQASGFMFGGWPGSLEDNMQPNLPQLYIEIDMMRDNGDEETSEMASTLSQNLGSMWDDAWMVAVASLNNVTIDLVFYGYAFRNHWFWHNNYRDYSWVVWKDYNCQSWFLYDSQDNGREGNSFDGWAQSISAGVESAFESEISNLTSEGIPNIWILAERFAYWTEQVETFNNTYTSIAFQSGPSDDYVSRWSFYFCHHDPARWGSFLVSANISGSTHKWNYFVYQTRVGHYSQP